MNERRTNTHVYFLGGIFSQWYSCEFVASPYPSVDECNFTSAEQYMMATKALLFHDVDIYYKIMDTNNPAEQKALGRKVSNFDKHIWDCCARELVYRGNMAKFSQNTDLKQYLLDTGNRYIVEGSKYDSVWGVKLAWNDLAIEDSSNWRGTNWLGEVLMRVRENLS